MQPQHSAMTMNITPRAMLLGLLLVASCDVVHPFAPVPIRTPSSSIRSLLLRREAHNLNTAFEWLADDRENELVSYSCLSWLDPAVAEEKQTSANDVDEPSETRKSREEEMPIYPIGATYLPSGTTHFLNNMEPRNVQMAIDLSRQKQPQLFCAVLSASDTGRVARVGTVLEVVDIDIQRADDVAIRKIRVTCQPKATVDIVSIVNPEAASWESRIRKSPDYLKAIVRYRDSGGSMENENLITSLLDDYNAIRDLYQNGVGTKDLPPFVVQSLQEALSEWTVDDLQSDGATFWACIEQWQTLCNTVRESQQMILATNRNEVMIAAAAAKGGPLKLPIHEADLSPDVRRQLQAMEVQAQEDFLETGMDPCLDFQVLLSLSSHGEKLQFLSTMIGRERQRLESLEQDAVLEERSIEIPVEPMMKKGAWFDDSAWEDPPGRRLDEEILEGSLSFNSTQLKD